MLMVLTNRCAEVLEGKLATGKLEVCVESLDAVRIAIEAGADRIELCERLDVGGVTPSPRLVNDAISICRKDATAHRSDAIPVIVLIRCRAGDFFFNASEQRQMLDEIRNAVDAGCAGVAVGASIPGNTLNWEFFEAIAMRYSQIANVELVSHRVFDSVPDPMFAIPRLIELGFRRVLTSGGADHAIDSLASLREWQHAFGDQIEILPAGGISSSNAMQILDATGCRQLHGSFRGSERIDGLRIPDPEEIHKVLRALTRPSGGID